MNLDLDTCTIGSTIHNICGMDSRQMGRRFLRKRLPKCCTELANHAAIASTNMDHLRPRLHSMNRNHCFISPHCDIKQRLMEDTTGDVPRATVHVEPRMGWAERMDFTGYVTGTNLYTRMDCTDEYIELHSWWHIFYEHVWIPYSMHMSSSEHSEPLHQQGL